MRRFVFLACLLCNLSIFYRRLYVAGHPGCARPTLNTKVFQPIQNHGGCTLLQRVCADDGMLVTFDNNFVAENLTRGNPLSILSKQSGLWNYPARGGANSDALIGHQPNSFVPIRPASRMEAAPHLRQPVFSACTLPVIMVTDWPYNFHEVFAQLASAADFYFRQQGMIDDLATLVLATPWGLGVTSFHQVLLSPYSRYPLISFDELSQRPIREHKVAWSAEGHHVSCFEQAVLCKLHGFPQNMAPTAATILRHIGPLLPPDPLGFSPPGGPPVAVAVDTTLRVLVEARSGPNRNIKNMQQLIDACEAANGGQGFSAGSFSRLSCKVLHTGDTPALHGVPRFYATVGAVQSAHVLVAVHGAGASNSFFLQSLNGGTALIEIRPCGFGTKHCGWPDAYMRQQHDQTGFAIRFFALNVEDPAQCSPSDFAEQVGADDMRARDQHVTLAPGAFVAMLRHVGGLLRDPGAWAAAQAAGEVHGYAVAQGLALGPQCVQDLEERLRFGLMKILN